ncbi:MAG: ribonuclease HII [Sporomusaceae bacterium]|nr:ribonuclease HII [Sporomusaceae bacterium]
MKVDKQCICGCDEVGRGAGAGEIYVAAVILDPNQPIEGLNDSKKLTPRRREILAEIIKEKAIAVTIATASLDEIAELNVLHATLLAMKRAIESLPVLPDKVMIDGNKAPKLSVPCETIIKGDSLVPAISAASIVAKVARDQVMTDYEKVYPLYGFAHHKGYFTKEHLANLQKYGPCPIHRVTYGPVKELLQTNPLF